ncbi:MAG: FliC/FljB family flagellin [Polaromonas sp.]
MSSVINTNALSLLTQNNLNKSQGALNSAIERLSSGMRINSAKDDAAGQAIANRFTSNIRGLTQASRNANDGISLAQTTEGALSEINTNLQRIRELTVQSANGSNSSVDQGSIQAEITQRLDEIQRTSDQTDFNGVKVLKDGVTSLSIQVGANDNETISIDLKAINPEKLNLKGFNVVNGIDTAKVAGSATSTAAVAEVATMTPGAGLTAGQTVTVAGLTYTSTAATTAAELATAFASLADGATLNAAATKGTFTGALTGYSTGAVAAGAVAFTASAAGTATDLTVTGTGAGAAPVAVTTQGRAALTGADNGKVFAYTGGAEGGTSGSVIKDTVGSVTSYYKATIGTDGAVTRGDALTTTPATAKPLETLDAALKTVDTLRGALGAVQNRFDSIISNLGTTVNNLKSSRSRIEDADYATEVSNMSRAQILQQAGTSVLSQANQTTQGVLSLLR